MKKVLGLISALVLSGAASAVAGNWSVNVNFGGGGCYSRPVYARPVYGGYYGGGCNPRPVVCYPTVGVAYASGSYGYYGRPAYGYYAGRPVYVSARLVYASGCRERTTYYYRSDCGTKVRYRR